MIHRRVTQTYFKAAKHKIKILTQVRIANLEAVDDENGGEVLGCCQAKWRWRGKGGQDWRTHRFARNCRLVTFLFCRICCMPPLSFPIKTSLFSLPHVACNMPLTTIYPLGLRYEAKTCLALFVSGHHSPCTEKTAKFWNMFLYGGKNYINVPLSDKEASTWIRHVYDIYAPGHLRKR